MWTKRTYRLVVRVCHQVCGVFHGRDNTRPGHCLTNKQEPPSSLVNLLRNTMQIQTAIITFINNHG